MDEAVAQTIEVYDIMRLLKTLPHRYPFLLVDRIIEAKGDESGIGIKNVSVNEPQFQGHFPELRLCLAFCSSKVWRKRPARFASMRIQSLA